MNISFQQIQYILSLAEHLNFGKAAEACFVTQPTLSMQVKKAEDMLGHRVFDRKRSPLELTAFGKKLLPFLYETQADFGAIQRLSDESKGTYREEIRIGIIPTIASYLVPKIFKQRDKLNEKIKWSVRELKSEDVLLALEQKKIDLGIMAGPVTEERLVSVPLYNEEIKVYYPLDHKKHMEVARLERLHPWLLSKGNCLRTQMIHFCALNEEAAQADWNYEGGNIEMLLKMVDHYGGYTLVPEFYQQIHAFKKGSLKHVYQEDKNNNPARNVVGLMAVKNAKHPDLLKFLSLIKLEFADEETKHRQLEILHWK